MMTIPTMIKCKLNGNVIDIQENSSKAGALLDAFPPKAGQSLTEPVTPAANQTWDVLPDPAGSRHFIIQNPATGHCIDIQANSTGRGASLDAYPVKQSDNQNQLWDFLPDPFGSGYFFIQNPQTGYVIEIEKGSLTTGASLIVNPRRLFDNNFQLWTGVGQAWTEAPFKTPQLAAPPTAGLSDTSQYVLLPTDQTKKLTGVTVTLDIIEDLVADSFSVQINGLAPYPPPKGVTWDAVWIQFGLVMQNNTLVLFNQIWPAVGPVPAGNPLPSEDAWSNTLLTLKNNTVPAGTQIVLTLSTDTNDYVTGISGKIYDKSGSPIGTPQNWPAAGPNHSFTGRPVKESDLAPLGSFQVVVVGAPGGHAHFTSGMGTITVKCTSDISALLDWPNPEGGGTGETSNCYYSQVQAGYSHQIAQPFGVPSPKITSVMGDYTFAGIGLLPNSKLSATAVFKNQSTGKVVDGTVYPAGLRAQNDGSFSLIVDPQDPSVEHNPVTLTTTVTDADGNWAKGVITTAGYGTPQVTSTSGLHT